jgi:hypothetical protein
MRDCEHICREARWFLDGDASMAPPPGPPQRRIDVYELASLRPWVAVKRRGQSRLERKSRVGRVELVMFDGLAGFVETWIKDGRASPPTEAEWLAVRKEWWTCGQVEIGRFEVADRHGWTVNVDMAHPPNRSARAALGSWHAHLLECGTPSSYPAWLDQHVSRGRSTPRSAMAG